MQEAITIHHLRSVATADLNGFKDVLEDSMAEQGSTVNVLCLASTPGGLKGSVVSIGWVGNFSFQTPDGQFTFGGEDLKVVLSADSLDHNTLARFEAVRSAAIAKAYRHALRGILNLASDIKSGAVTVAGDRVEYLEQTLANAVNAFPNSN